MQKHAPGCTCCGGCDPPGTFTVTPKGCNGATIPNASVTLDGPSGNVTLDTGGSGATNTAGSGVSFSVTQAGDHTLTIARSRFVTYSTVVNLTCAGGSTSPTLAVASGYHCSCGVVPLKDSLTLTDPQGAVAISYRAGQRIWRSDLIYRDTITGRVWRHPSTNGSMCGSTWPGCNSNYETYTQAGQLPCYYTADSCGVNLRWSACLDVNTQPENYVKFQGDPYGPDPATLSAPSGLGLANARFDTQLPRSNESKAWEPLGWSWTLDARTGTVGGSFYSCPDNDPRLLMHFASPLYWLFNLYSAAGGGSKSWSLVEA